MIRLYLQSRYRRLYRQVQHLLRSGRFARLTRRRRDQLVQRLRRYEVRLSRMGMAAMTTAALFAGGVELEGQVQAEGTEFEVATTSPANLFKTSPTVALNDDGDYVVAYKTVSTSNEVAVYVQRYDNSGDEVGAPILVSDQDVYSYLLSEAAVAIDDDGDFVVAWQTAIDTGAGSDITGAMMRAYHSDGTPATDVVQVSDSTLIYVGQPSVAMDDDGDFAVAFTYFDPVTEVAVVNVNRYNSDGTDMGAAIQVAQGSYVYTLLSRVAMDDDGDFVVLHNVSNAGYELQAQRYANDGTPIGGGITVTSVPTDIADFDYGHDIDMDNDGNFVATWVDGSSGYSLYAQRYANDGTAVGGTVLIDQNSYYIAFPSVAMNDDGDYGITWMAYNFDSYSYNIYYQDYTPAAEAVGDVVEVTNSVSGLEANGLSFVAMNDDGDVIITWTRVSTDNIYEALGQRYISLTSSLEPTPTGAAPITVFPNPATDRLYLRDAQPGRVAVYDMLGRMTHQATLVGSQNSIDVSTLRSGQYVLVHTDEHGAVSTAKFVK